MFALLIIVKSLLSSKIQNQMLDQRGEYLFSESFAFLYVTVVIQHMPDFLHY